EAASHGSLLENHAAGEDLEDHAELEVNEGVAQHCVLEYADSEPLHDEEKKRVTSDPAGVGTQPRSDARDWVGTAETGHRSQKCESTDQPRTESEFRRSDQGS